MRSCNFLPPQRGYKEARRLLRKKFGDDYRIAAAYENKALNWPEVRTEDSIALNRFSIFLTRCKNTIEGRRYLSKLTQPETIQKLVLKLPFSLRTRWHRLVDHIMEVELRLVNFGDLADFVDNEARVATNQVFGRIMEDVKPRATVTSHLRKKPGERKSPELSLATQVHSNQCPPTVAPCCNPSSPEDNSKCPFCKSDHALDYCDSLRSRLYPERIQFLMLKNLCFGCLSNNHTAQNCPERKTCSFPNCTKKHPTVHTNSTARS